MVSASTSAMAKATALARIFQGRFCCAFSQRASSSPVKPSTIAGSQNHSGSHHRSKSGRGPPRQSGNAQRAAPARGLFQRPSANRGFDHVLSIETGWPWRAWPPAISPEAERSGIGFPTNDFVSRKYTSEPPYRTVISKCSGSSLNRQHYTLDEPIVKYSGLD